LSEPSAIAHYRITAKLGEGGMGAVYRATDTKLNREVAIKVLPPAFAEDSGRMQRFEREGLVLAALNHPNIAAIYGVEQGAIVMELVDGEDLKGPVPVETAIGYARQMVSALEAAHEKGIVHRDLKPANIKVTPAGVVKVLDFGLAKTPEAASAVAGASPTISPTLSLAMTQAGMILGTAAYMSPEQARGKEIDRRADIWAFGVILYELLTGALLYGGGETVTDTLAAVVLKEPDYSRLPAETPARLRRLIRVCLQKDPQQRMRDISGARLLLDQDEPEATAVPAAKRSWLPWAVAAMAVAVAGVAGTVAWQRPKAAEPVTVRFPFIFPEGTTESSQLAAAQIAPSPDGRSLAFTAVSNSQPALWIRPMGSPTAHRLDKTEGANLPFWSPDGQFLAYFADNKLKRVAAAGGPVQTLTEVDRSEGAGGAGRGTGRTAGDGGTWNTAGEIVYSGGGGSPLMRTTATGGPGTPATKLDQAAGETRHSWPQFLPDGKHVLYFALNDDPQKSGIYVQELGSSNRVLVTKNQTRGVWAPPGYLLFARESTLFAQRMDPRSFQLTGEPAPVAEEVIANDVNGRSAFAVSANGVLVYRAGLYSVESRLTWVDRRGTRQDSIGKPGLYHSLKLSPDERSAIVTVGPPNRTDYAIMDLATGVVTPATTDGKAHNVLGPWSPDSQRIAINRSDVESLLEFNVASGKSRELKAEGLFANDWSADGRFLLCGDRVGTRFGLLPTDGGPLRVLSDTPYRKISFRLSPDGKFVSYTSYESGRPQVVVAAYPSFAEKRQVSLDEGRGATWRKDGRELFFRAGNNLVSIEIKTEPRIEAGVPQALFPLAGSSLSALYAPSGDGKRFLTIDRGDVSTRNQSETMVVVNWAAELKEQ
jgi:Tol biopolymer transport system component/predicted Ser/Thr protein kinase